MIVIPMAGLSSRFTAQGYTVPKYRLELGSKTVMHWVLAGFRSVFETEPFLFVLREDADKDFVSGVCEELGIREFQVVSLGRETKGQAETVLLGLAEGRVAGDVPLCVFNADTFRQTYRSPDWTQTQAVGRLEVFRGSGDNWSYVRPDTAGTNPMRVLETAEKRAISDLCCTGLYSFRSAQVFESMYQESLRAEARTAMEQYVAPMYNTLIAAGNLVEYALIPRSEVIFCGVPAEYEALRNYDLQGFFSSAEGR